MKKEGRCWKFGDNIPTDQIVKSNRVLWTIDKMAEHVLEDLNPDFPKSVKTGDILVAGKHFGQSSGRAVAPKAIKATGISVVIVEYAARLFYRNCFECGLPILECEGITKKISDGDIISVDMETGLIENKSTDEKFYAKPVSPFLSKMLEAGGLIPFAPQMDQVQ